MQFTILCTTFQELVDDYGVYEYPEWFVELAKEYGAPQDFITKKDSQKPGFYIASYTEFPNKTVFQYVISGK